MLVASVMGCKRVPDPPARMMPFIVEEASDYQIKAQEISKTDRRSGKGATV